MIVRWPLGVWDKHEDSVPTCAIQLIICWRNDFSTRPANNIRHTEYIHALYQRASYEASRQSGLHTVLLGAKGRHVGRFHSNIKLKQCSLIRDKGLFIRIAT